MNVGRLGVALLLAALTLLPALAHADALDDGVRRIGLQLQCPVCEGQSIADSPSGLAQDMRAVIRTKLAAGESDRQILDEFVASYGDSILADPPKRGISLGVWLGPSIGVLLGAVVLGLLLRTWLRARAPLATATPSLTLPDAEVTEEFQRFRQEVGG